MPISFVRQNGAQGNTGAISFAMQGPVAVGDLLVAEFGWTTATANRTPTISDNVNAGAWNVPPALKFVNLGALLEIQLAWIRCDTAGTPTISSSGLGTDGNSTNLDVSQFNGFAHGPSLVSADATTNSGSSAAPSGTGFSNSFANELSVAYLICAGGQNIASTSGSFTMRAGVVTGIPNRCLGDVVNASSGNALTFGATISSANWAVMLASFQDLAPPSIPFMGQICM
jgi:hypothetical protein